MEEMDIVEGPQIQVRFFTKQEQYAVPDTSISIPVAYGIAQLNTLINKLISSDDLESEISFDFLIDGEFLRVGLEEHLQERNLLADHDIAIEYVESASPPTPSDSITHDDWVTAVRATKGFILSGAYDNIVRLWTEDGQLVHAISGHLDVIKSVAWVTDEDDVEKKFISASNDGTARLWQWKEGSKLVKCIGVCSVPESKDQNHASLSKGIETVAVNETRTMFATGSLNCAVNIWSTDPSANSSETTEKPKKKRKLEKPDAPNMQSLGSLEGHTQCVKSVCWLDDKTVCSASFDHNIHLWDVRKGVQKRTINWSKAFFDVRYSPLNQLLIAGSADRVIRLFDTKSTGGLTVKTNFSSHSLMVSCVDWSPVSEFHFVSGSYDKLFKLWDTRSPKAPLYDMIGHEDKILCADWSVPEMMISGGADKHLRIFKSSENSTDASEN